MNNCLIWLGDGVYAKSLPLELPELPPESVPDPLSWGVDNGSVQIRDVFILLDGEKWYLFR